MSATLRSCASARLNGRPRQQPCSAVARRRTAHAPWQLLTNGGSPGPTGLRPLWSRRVVVVRARALILQPAEKGVAGRQNSSADPLVRQVAAGGDLGQDEPTRHAQQVRRFGDAQRRTGLRRLGADNGSVTVMTLPSWST